MRKTTGTGKFSLTAPAGRERVAPVLEGHLPRFGQVLVDAWDGYATARRLAAKQMANAGASARGMLVSDFTREPAHRIFNQVPEATVNDDRFGRPWVSLAGGKVRIRFRKLTPDLGVCRSDSDRAISLAYHLGDPYLPGMESFTVLTAGYVLNAAEDKIERLAMVCHLGFTEVIYSLPIPLAHTISTAHATSTPAAATAVATDTATDAATDAGASRPVQLPLAPLSPPIIRSAQRAAAKRLATGSSTPASSEANSRAVDAGLTGGGDA